jgi:hypothetical protein
MVERRESLDDLGLKHGTDKSSYHHNYLKFYERYLEPLRDREIKFLEIGIFNGASLSVWEEYFPKATIVGMDINTATLRFARGRVLVELADQSNVEDLVQLGMKHGPFDVIIDDGSHMWEHQLTSLKTLFPFVKEGGIYVVEDLQTNYGAFEPSYRGVSSISCVDYLKALVDLRVADEQIDIEQMEDPFLRTYGRAMQSIVFSRHVCLIEKKIQHLLIDKVPYIIVTGDAAFVPLFIIAHVGNEGDRGGAFGWLRPLKPDQFIQGFTFEAPKGKDCALSYRARLSTGEWTDWVSAGALAGARGTGENLTGFSVRLEDRSRDKFSLEVAGEFANGPEPVIVGDGEDCVAPAGIPLAGMQIVLRTRAG